MFRTDMLEHSDRDDSIEAVVEQPVIDQLELHMIRSARRSSALASDLELMFGQSDSEHVDASDFVQIESHPAPSAADVENMLAGRQREFCRKMRFLVGLRLLEAVIRIREVGAAILLVLVEEEFVQLVLQIVMV